MMDKLNVVNAFNGMLFTLKQDGTCAICYSMINFENIVLSEINQSQKEKYCIIPLM